MQYTGRSSNVFRSPSSSLLGPNRMMGDVSQAKISPALEAQAMVAGQNIGSRVAEKLSPMTDSGSKPMEISPTIVNESAYSE